MTGKIAIGIQSFAQLRESGCFYVDKTDFIKEWWDSHDSVTLITRPRRFGKTLNMSMLESFFSVDYAGRGDLFEGLSIWNDENYRKIQGTYPVIFLSFANVKENGCEQAKTRIKEIITDIYSRNYFLRDSDVMTDIDRKYFDSISVDMDDTTAASSLGKMSGYLSKYYGKKVIILLDEYDTPMQEAYVDGYWDDLVAFTRSLFNSTFKTNPYLERAVMTGITRVSMESMFSDLNNLNVVTTTSDEYATSFGFTEKEVFDALDGHGLSDKKELVKEWYDGFIFGKHSDIYNPWSIINFLDKGRIGLYWANTSSNSLAGKLVRQGSRKVKMSFEKLLAGESICCAIDEQIVYNQLDGSESAIYSLLLASGYLKVVDEKTKVEFSGIGLPEYELALTNLEVRNMFMRMVHDWFNGSDGAYNDFVEALLAGNLKAMNTFMNRVSLSTFSYFDTEKGPSFDAPERFYHGFVLGLIADLSDRYVITSNRESGFGRYDVMLEPRNVLKDAAFIFGFKVHDPDDEKSLEDTVKAAHEQIDEKQYEASLIAQGVPSENIRKYGFAFEGKKVLIG